MNSTQITYLFMSKVLKFKILPNHMLVSNRDFSTGTVCNNNFELRRQKLSSAKDTIIED